ncbi:hypothetical protein J8631_27920, partial [Serratia fonticola]|uniref:hypothetical protein n=1 Tax=Serratia fonticola TaxID=47917 RepID=UPI001AE980B0
VGHRDRRRAERPAAWGFLCCDSFRDSRGVSTIDNKRDRMRWQPVSVNDGCVILIAAMALYA